MTYQTIVIDNGSFHQKVGFAGSIEPFVEKSTRHNSIDGIEDTWSQCFYETLRVNPEDHPILLTDAVLRTPEEKQTAAEIIFETFNVPALHIAPQSILSLISSFAYEEVEPSDLTGLILDSGHSSTNVVPVVDGRVLTSKIKSLNVGGKQIISHIQQHLRKRKEPMPNNMQLEIATSIKETLTYVCPNIEKEHIRFDGNPEKHVKIYQGIEKKTGERFECQVQHERFLAPELIMEPKLIDESFTESLAEMVDNTIQSCPVDTRRRLYNNIILSGGNTSFPHFEKRLQKDVKELIHDRLSTSNAIEGIHYNSSDLKVTEVNVSKNHAGIFSAWFGGSIVASSSDFQSHCFTKENYEEEGAYFFRKNDAFNIPF
ncbi:hypothetical protein CTEN210_09988 [Chaetoceros tenuissimus]|uniref:Actin n=1 Tax=Chaetoceros tenuissimus TaxID=426638 RepID=A0AAD3CWV6_9STRA|nr:hypothetical protein CTEN210_09988 [Chaetoceros tenuissimus]